MATQNQQPGPDLSQGIAASSIPEGEMVQGHVGGAPVLVARSGGQLFAIGAKCTHYGGPLGRGIVVGDTVRCPWHHACFSLKTGEPLRAPALNRVDCWNLKEENGKVSVTGKAPPPPRRKLSGNAPGRVVIVGAGAAGNAAAEMLRQEGYDGSITLIGAEPSVPYDRPNLSKDYLAGTAPEDWIPLRSTQFYAQQRIELVLGARGATIDPKNKRVTIESGEAYPYDALLLATGADPVKLSIPGADLPHVFMLRTLADSRAIIAQAQKGRGAVIMGASFIGLEVAASLRAQNVEVAVVSPEAVPMERSMGPQLGQFIRKLHEEHGVVFHLGETARAIGGANVTLQSGAVLPADFVVVGVGVRPAVSLASAAGLATDNGVLVNEWLQTSTPDIFAAGDIARWPDPHSGERIRIEHWVVAQRQGQTAARNILGLKQRFDAVPFFWSVHYDMTIRYVGHPSRWDGVEISGNLEARDSTITFKRGGKTLAVATIGRDRENLEAEVALERAHLQTPSA
jgi:NADPH-dependent 2,4-dienoyl-CoA reductase/sulfur reductase-like enzyme/nitrite reductase/ring-hydroxylating ferredoxin subunit